MIVVNLSLVSSLAQVLSSAIKIRPEIGSIGIIITDQFFQPDQFQTAIVQVQQNPKLNQLLIGLVVPHHLVASNLIADGFRQLQPAQPDLIVLLGPNHFQPYQEQIITTVWDWQTRFGEVKTDQIFVRQLLVQPQIGQMLIIDNETAANDHALGNLMPFIKYYLPQARVVSFLIPAGMSQVQLDELAQAISQVLSQIEDTFRTAVIVGSIDFSHYLSPVEAAEKDEFTRQVIEKKDWETLLRLNDDYLDSPGAFYLTYWLSQSLGASVIEIFANSNSGLILDRTNISSTSYFEIGFY